MLKKTITYVDYNGNQRTEDFYFHLTQTKLVEVAMDLPDGLLDAFDETQGVTEEAALSVLNKLGKKGTFQFLKDLVMKAYGVKSDDGRGFIQNENLSLEFSYTPAFDAIMVEFMSDDLAASNFVNGVIPAKVSDKVEQAMAKATPTLVPQVTPTVEQ